MILSLECGAITFLNVGWWINVVVHVHRDVRMEGYDKSSHLLSISGSCSRALVQKPLELCDHFCHCYVALLQVIQLILMSSHYVGIEKLIVELIRELSPSHLVYIVL